MQYPPPGLSASLKPHTKQKSLSETLRLDFEPHPCLLQASF